MTSARGLSVKRGETVNYYRPDQLVIRPDLNARDLTTPDNVAHVEWLAGEMKAKGFTTRLSVMMWEGELVLTEGHCRTAAAKLCMERGWLPADTLLPALTEPKGTSLVDLWARQVSGNGTSKALNTEELLANVKRLLTIGKSVADIAKLFGKSEASIETLLRFESAPTEVHKMVAEGKVSLTTAEKTVRKKGGAEGAKVLKEAVEKAKSEGRTKAGPADIEPKPVRLSNDLIESMITMLRMISAGGSAYQSRVDVLLARIDELRWT